jgi:hypothetical protein
MGGAKTFRQFRATWVEDDTQDREGCEIVWNAVTKAEEEKFTSTNDARAHHIAQEPQERHCDHHFVGNDYLCKKCGLYFPETNT